MWEGISRPGPGRDGMGGKEREILVPGDVQVEGPKSVGNPAGCQGPAKIIYAYIIFGIIIGLTNRYVYERSYVIMHPSITSIIAQALCIHNSNEIVIWINCYAF